MSISRKKIYKSVYSQFNQNFSKNIHFNNNLNSNSNDNICDMLFAPVQTENFTTSRKISVIGAGGNIGQIMAYELLLKSICDEIVLFDVPELKGKTCGIALDLLDGSSAGHYTKLKVCMNGVNTKNSDLLIICAGIGVKKNQTRLEVLKDNADAFKKLIPMLVEKSPNSVLLIASNPVDIMSYAAWKFSGFPVNRIVGSGTVLDSYRFRYLLSKKLGISPLAINAYVIGEHGQSCVPCWSTVSVGGTRLKDCKESFGLENDSECFYKLEKELKERANVIKNYKGFTSYGISQVIIELAEAIIMDRRTVYPVSTNCDGINGLKSTSFISLPAVLGSRGIQQIIKPKLSDKEQAKLQKSAEILDKVLATYKFC